MRSWRGSDVEIVGGQTLVSVLEPVLLGELDLGGLLAGFGPTLAVCQGE